MKNSLLLFASMVICLSTFGQSTENYVFSTNTNGSLIQDANGNPIDMSTGATLLLGSGSSNVMSAIKDMNFKFTLNGNQYNQYSVNTNGFVILGSVSATLAYVSYFDFASTERPMISAFAGTMATNYQTGNIKSKITGTSPNRCLVVQFTNLGYYTYNSMVTNQVRLYESGMIELVYGQVYDQQTSGSMSYSIGFASGASKKLATITASTNTSTPYPMNFYPNKYNFGAPIPNLHSPVEGSRRVYRYTPPIAPAAPTNLVFSGVTSNDMVLNWTDNANNESGYRIYRSDDGGINYNYVTTVDANVNFYNQELSLASGTTFYWKVLAFNEAHFSSELPGNQSTTLSGTIKSTATGGSWDVPGTWLGGLVPTANDNVVIANGATVTLSGAGVKTCNKLNIGEGISGILRYSTSAATLTVNGSVTVASGGTFDAGTDNLTHNLNIGGNSVNSMSYGNIINNGTFDMYSGASAGKVAVTFYGTPDASVSGTGTYDFFTMALQKGNVTATYLVTPPVLEIVSPFTVMGSTTDGFVSGITTGVLKISGTSSFNNPVFLTEAYNLPAKGGFWLNNPNFTITGMAASPKNSGLLRLTAGTWNIGTATNHSLTDNTGAVFVIEGGALNIAGCFASSNSGTCYQQSGGTVTVSIFGNTTVSLPGFGITNNYLTRFTMSGGAIVIQQANTSATPIDYSLKALYVNITGGTLTLGNALSGTAQTFRIGSITPSVVMNNVVSNHSTEISTDMVICGDLTINPTCSFNVKALLTLKGNSALYPGNINNSGTMDLSTNMTTKLIFNSTFGNQYFLNTGTIINNKLAGLTVNNIFPSGTVTLPAGIIVSSQYYSGPELNLTNGLLIASGFVLCGGGNEAFNFTRTNGALANAASTNFGTGSIVYRYNGSSAAVMDKEAPSTPILELYIDNPGGVSLPNNLTISRHLNLYKGVLSATGTITLGNGTGTFDFVQTGGTMSFTPLFNFTSVLTYYTYGSSNGVISTGPELPNFPISEITFNNPKGVILTKNVVTGTSLNLKYGVVSGPYNITIGSGGTNNFWLSKSNGSISCPVIFNLGTGTNQWMYVDSDSTTAIKSGSELPSNGVNVLEIANNYGLTIDKDLNIGYGTAQAPKLIMNQGNLNIGTHNLTLGLNTTLSGTLENNYNNRCITTSGGTFTRWFPAVGLPTSAPSRMGAFPMGEFVGGAANLNYVQVYFSSAAALSTGGTITCGITRTPGITAGLNVNDGGFMLNSRTNTGWTLTPGNGMTATGTFSMRVTGAGTLVTGNFANLHLMKANSVVGTHAAGTNSNDIPEVSRTGLSLADFADPFYIGGATADLNAVIYSAQSGNWNDPASWLGGIVPVAANNAIILSTHNILVNGPQYANSLTIKKGGSISMSSGTLSVSNIMDIAGTLTQNGGNLNITTKLLISGTATFNSGSTLWVLASLNDGLTIYSSGVLLLNGGTITLGLGGLNNRRLFIHSSGILNVVSGILNINGILDTYSPSEFNQSGGNINIDPSSGNWSTSSSSSVLAIRGSVNWTGGTITMIDPNMYGNPIFEFLSEVDPVVSPSHIFMLGDGISSDNGTGGYFHGFGLKTVYRNHRLNFGTLVINGTGNGTAASTYRIVQQDSNPIGVQGDLTINDKGEFDLNEMECHIGGNILVNAGGIFTANGTVITGKPAYYNYMKNNQPQSIGGAGTFRNKASSSTASFKNLNMYNDTATGLTITSPISVSDTLFLTSGVLKTSATGLLTVGTATTAGLIKGGSLTAYVSGPMAYTFPAGHSSSGTDWHFIPIGKDGHFKPVYLNPTTSPNGIVRFKCEAFNTNSGGMGVNTINMSNSRWECIPVVGIERLVGTKVQLYDPAIVLGNQILQASTFNGYYNRLVAPITYASLPEKNLSTNSNVPKSRWTGYLTFGTLTACPPPTAQPTDFVLLWKRMTSFKAAFSPPAAAPSHYLAVRYPAGGTPTAPVTNTNYLPGDRLGAGTVVYTETDSAFTDSLLIPGNTYDYYIYSFNYGNCFGPVYLTTSPLFASVTLCISAVEKPGTPAGSDVTHEGFTVSWTASATPGVSYILEVATDDAFETYVNGYQHVNVGAGILTYNVTGLQSGTFYYVRVMALNTQTMCNSDYSNTLLIQTKYCINPSLGGTISAGSHGCSPFNPSEISSINLPTGHTGTLEYKWQSSTDNITFTDISNATAESYDPGNLEEITFFRRISKVSCKASWTDAAISNVTIMTVIPSGDVTKPADQAVCNGSSTASVNFTSSVVGNTYSWTNNNTTIGLGASGTGDINSFIATNATNAPVVATVTVTPTLGGPQLFAYIPNSGSNDVSVINTTTNIVIATIAVGSQPSGVLASLDGSKVYVSNTGDNTVSVINTADNTVAAILNTDMQPFSMCLSPDGSKVYVSNNSSGNLSVIDVATNTIIGTTYYFGGFTQGVVTSPDGSTLYLANSSFNFIYVINSNSLAVSNFINLNYFPYELCIHPNGNILYASNPSGNRVSVIDLTTNLEIGSVDVGVEPSGMVCSADGNKLYVANRLSNSVTVINTADNTVLSTISVGSTPYGLSLSPDGNILLVANSGSNNVFIINTTTNTVESVVTVGSTPYSLGHFTIVTGVACSGTPKSFTITVNPDIAAGSIAGGTAVCPGINSTTLTLSGYAGSIVRWESSTDNWLTTANITNTTTTLVINNLNTTTKYRAIVKSGVCSSATSAVATIDVGLSSVGGIVTIEDAANPAPGPLNNNSGLPGSQQDPSFCEGDNNINLNLTGQTGNVVKWQSSTTNWATFTDIASTLTTLNLVNLTVTTKYRAIVQDGTCAKDTSLDVTVTIVPATIGGTLSGSSDVCINVNSANMSLSGHTGTIVRWEFSTDDFATTTNITNITTAYTATNLSVTTKYRAVVKSGVCSEAYSSPAVITVHALPEVAFEGTLDDIALCASPLALTGGIPVGGTYSGSGVSNGNFDPTVVGPGMYTLTYTYTDSWHCTNSATNTINVLQPETYTYFVGVGGDFSNLTGADGLFAFLNTNRRCGDVFVYIMNDLSENGLNGLNQSNEVIPGGYNLVIFPIDETVKVISGNVGQAMIRLNGIDRITIDGGIFWPYRSLRFRNNNTLNPGIQIVSGVVNASISGCEIEGNNINTASGVIVMDATAGANSNIQFYRNIIGNISSSANAPANLFYATGAGSVNSYISLSTNEFKNYASNGINVNSTGNGSYWNVYNNSFYATMTFTGNQTAINFNPGSSSQHNILNNNYIGGSNYQIYGSNFINSGNGTFKGISINAGSSTLANNTIGNIKLTNTTSQNFTGIEINAGTTTAGPGNIIGSANVMYSISIAGVNSTFYGFKASATGQSVTLKGNTVANINLYGTTGSPKAYCYYLKRGTADQNRIFNIGSINSILTPWIYGIYQESNGNSNTISNNMISLKGGNAANPKLFGIYDKSTGTAGSIIHNTVSIQGTAYAAATNLTSAFYREGSASLVLYNNIFHNAKGTTAYAKHYSLYSTSTSAITSNYNNLVTVSPNLVYWGGTAYNNISLWKGTGRDAGSISISPIYVSVNDLHLTAANTGIDNKGSGTNSSNHDFDGASRNGSKPDMGCDEFVSTAGMFEPGVVEESIAQPTLSIYPNPMSTSAMLTVRLGAESKINLKIYNYLGELILTIDEQLMAKGENNLEFNAMNLRGGIYFCRIIVNDEQIVVKRIEIIR
jgi:YVTN family beta-propeller protein